MISRLAKGGEVVADFGLQLNRLYDAMEKYTSANNHASLDHILSDWIALSPESVRGQERLQISHLLNQMIPATIQMTRDNLVETEALDYLTAILPILSDAVYSASRLEMEMHAARISGTLEQAREILQQQDRSKSKFISVAAHELKTPLTLLEGYTSMLAASLESKNADVLALIEGVKNGIARLRRIVDDMIDISVIDTNSLKLSHQPVKLVQIMESLKSEVTKFILERRQSLVIKDFPGNDDWISADPDRLYQAFSNIVMNAIKFTPDKGVISIDGRSLPGFIEITIADTGVGIPFENQELIFTKFGQLGDVDLHSSGRTKFLGGGPGLGLPIARGILEAHGGSIWVESAVKGRKKYPGSKFHVLIPRRSAQQKISLGVMLNQNEEIEHKPVTNVE